MSGPRHLTILGGGITGLAIAYLAARNGVKVRLLEASSECGGLLRTFPVGDNQLEFFYHHFFTHDREINWLLEALNLSDQLVFSPSSMGIFSDGRILPFNKPADLLRFKSLSLIDKLRFGLSTLYLGKLADWRDAENIPCLYWFRKYAGPGVTRQIWEPLLKVKFGEYADKVPLTWMIGRLRQRMGSRKNIGDERLGYLSGSLQKLLDALLANLEAADVEIITRAAIEGIEASGNTITAVQTTQGRFPTETIVSTIPTTSLSPLVKADFPEYAGSLERIDYFGAVCVFLELNRSLSPVYWLNIADSSMPFGGVIEHTRMVPPEAYGGRHIVYLSRYFSHQEAFARLNNDEIHALMMDALPWVFPNFKVDWVRQHHVFRTNTAANVCDLAFSERIPNCQTPVDNLFMAAMPHVYPDERSVNNSIKVALAFTARMGIPVPDVGPSNSLSAAFGFQ